MVQYEHTLMTNAKFNLTVLQDSSHPVDQIHFSALLAIMNKIMDYQGLNIL